MHFLEQERVDRINLSKLEDLWKNKIDDFIEKDSRNNTLLTHFKEIIYLETVTDKVRIKLCCCWHFLGSYIMHA